MLKFILFCDQKTAERNIGQPDIAVISITHRGAAVLQAGWFDVLRLEFQDTDDANELFAFDPLHAVRINDFVEDVKRRGAVGILVHCYAGESRSAAVAKWIAKVNGLPFDDRYKSFNQHVYIVLSEYGERHCSIPKDLQEWLDAPSVGKEVIK